MKIKLKQFTTECFKQHIFVHLRIHFPLNLKKVARLIQDVVSSHCGDKEMARRCTRSSLPNYFVMTLYHWNAGKTRQCEQR